MSLPPADTARLVELQDQRNAELARDKEQRMIATNVPACPTCKKPLIARPHHRRFMEDNRYVERANGHAFELRDCLLDTGLRRC
jgi:uncharacterized protein YbaR (Trm112 family)